MTFGPELSPEELKRRTRIVNRAGAVIFAAIIVGLLFGALVAPHLL